MDKISSNLEKENISQLTIKINSKALQHLMNYKSQQIATIDTKIKLIFEN